MNDNSLFAKPLQSLRQSLRALLRPRKGPSKSQSPSIVGSGILRKADRSSAYQLPQLSTVSLFPDFGANDFDIKQYAVRNRAQEHLPAPTSRQQPHSKHRLLPATSLSQFDLHTKYGEVRPHQVVYESVDGYLSGMSRQASLASLAPSKLHKSTSSLRIRESKPDLRSSAKSPEPPTTRQKSPAYMSNDVSRHGSRSLRRSSQITSSAAVRTSTSSTSSRARHTSPLTLVAHFQSHVILDTARPGCPVTATSAELSYIFSIGEEFFLNAHEAEGTSMDIVSGVDAVGNAVTHLVLFSPLIAPSSGRSRFIVGSLLDVTPFLEDTASMPELDTISEEGSVASLAEAVATPSMQSSPGSTNLNHELSVEDLLSGCCLSEDQPSKGRKSVQDDVWLDIAFTESQSRRINSRGRQHSTYAPPTPSARSARSSASSVDDVLDSFVSSLQSLYSDFFLLGKSPLDDDCYEIANVSPKVYEAKEYVDGHLSKSPRDTIETLSANLTQDTPFTLSVNWGSRGEPKQLYCSPLYGQSTVTWICFLVDPHVPMLR